VICVSRRYLLVSPCRDEADFLQVTIDSIASQTEQPAKWIIVDDGSTDDTPNILERAAKQYSFIQVVRRDDRGARAVGPGVIDAFYHGISQARLEDYDYLCKLDADLELGPRYFEHSMDLFEQDPWLGTLSGKLELHVGDDTMTERTGDENSVGAVKFYRVACFQDIGGFVRGVCWDGIDGHMCRLKGWVARSVDDPELRIGHLRQMGSSQQNLWHGRMRWGRGKYFMGSQPYYAAAVALYRALEPPYVVGGAGILWGYVKATLDRESRMEDPEYLEQLRSFELRSLLLGKRRTIEQENERIRKRPPRTAERA